MRVGLLKKVRVERFLLPHEIVEKALLDELRLTLASCSVATRPARVIGPLTLNDQNQRRLSGPPRVS